MAGPVVAAAVIIDSCVVVEGVNDSKALRERERDILFEAIYEKAVSVGVGVSDHAEIDSINILQATFLAMRRAVENLFVKPQFILVDGKMTIPGLDYPQEAVVRGDQSCASIAAASIIAKVTRDRLMKEYHEEYPGYGFDRHKGYPTKAHINAIRRHGPCSIHRMTFNKVR